MLILLQGRGELLRFEADGKLVSRSQMSAATRWCKSLRGVWHGFRVIQAGTAIMEVKPGPYRPSEFADWAPPKGDASAPEFLRQLMPEFPA